MIDFTIRKVFYMNNQLKEINSIISLCDAMIDEINRIGIIRTGNPVYEEYKKQIKAYCSSHNLMRSDYGPYAVLDKLYFPSAGYTVCSSEARMIRSTVVGMKHELYPNAYEKIFISHREKDKKQVEKFVDLLYAIGIPRPTRNSAERSIFCTSHPATYIENGLRNLEEIKEQFNSSEHIFYILWYTDHYFESQACLNEAGAIWALGKRYQEILAPGFAASKIGGLMDKQPTWMRSNDKYRLNTLKEQIEAMFCLKPLTLNAWESARDSYIAQIEAITGGGYHADA